MMIIFNLETCTRWFTDLFCFSLIAQLFSLRMSFIDLHSFIIILDMSFDDSMDSNDDSYLGFDGDDQLPSELYSFYGIYIVVLITFVLFPSC